MCDQFYHNTVLLFICDVCCNYDPVENNDLFSDDSEGADVGCVSDGFRESRESPPPPFDSSTGPYSALLQDFTLRSYMSGGKKSKPFLSSGKWNS